MPGMPSPVVGTYYNIWHPLGPTDKGFDFTAGFRLQDGNISAPLEFWISKETHVLLDVDSISSINRVISDTNRTGPTAADAKAAHFAIETARMLVCEKVKYQGATGIALTMSGRDLTEIIRRLSDAGLDDNTAKLIGNLGSSIREDVDVATKTWRNEWYEIDSLGGIDKVTVTGSLDPMKVVSILRQAVYGEGTVKPGLLRREIFFDLRLVR